ncbi:retropepsin-like aspartic protease, partial [Salmonella enterica subsp. enterica serovar Paratyphi A]
ILDSGAGVAIATKEIWKKWARPALRETCMKLQLADGHTERPLGLLEKLIVSSCGIEYKHTFVIVAFKQLNSYDIILGRPFMRQLKMVQDWGYNYIYLRHLDTTTHINLKNHDYRDVIRTPVEDFDSATTIGSEFPTGFGKPKELWMCGASQCGSLQREEYILETAINDGTYIPKPFLED